MTVAPAIDQPRMVTIEAAADYLGVSVKTIRRRIGAGDLRAYRLRSTRLIRLRLDDLDQLMQPVLGGDAA